MTRTHLGYRQSDGSPMTDTVKSHLSGTDRDALEADLQRVILGIQGTDGIVHHQLEGFQLLCQDFNGKH